MGIACKDKLYDALWAYRTAYNTASECHPINLSTEKLVTYQLS